MPASNESPISPLRENESPDPGWVVLLRVPDLAKADEQVESTAPTEPSPDFVPVPSVPDSNVESEPTPVEPMSEVASPLPPSPVNDPVLLGPKSLPLSLNWPDARDMTLATVRKFAGNLRFAGTLGTIVATIVVCTLVVRAMKQDHVPASDVDTMAFREPINEPTPPVEENTQPEAVTPEFDPATLVQQEQQVVEVKAALPEEWTLDALNPQVEGNTTSTNVASRQEAWPTLHQDPQPAEDMAIESVEDLPPTASIPWARPSTPEWSVSPPNHEATNSVSEETLQLTAPVVQDQLAPTTSNDGARGAAHFGGQSIRSIPKVQSGPRPRDVWPTRGDRMKSVVAPKRADDDAPPTYPKTSTAAYPSLQAWGASLYAQSERDRRVRVSDQRGGPSQPATGRHTLSTSEIVR